MCIGISQHQLTLNRSKKIINDSSRIEYPIDKVKTLNPKSHHIHLWKEAVIIPQTDPTSARLATFGWMDMKPNTKRGWPCYNVRVEGGFLNKGNDPNYQGVYQIFKNPYVKEIIMSQRCLIPCDFFVEKPEGNNKNKRYIIMREDGEAIHLAGVYKEIVDQETGEIRSAFTIKTTASSKITAKVDHPRSPVIIPNEYLFDYLNPKATEEELKAFYPPPESEGYYAHEVDPIIAKWKIPMAKDDPKLKEPIGDMIYP